MYKKLLIILLTPVMLSACVVGTTIYDDSYHHGYYPYYGHPYHGHHHDHYDYYYYPDVEVYFHIFTGYYFYHHHGHWVRVRHLPSHIHLHHHHRRHIIYRGDKPYLNHHEHRRQYRPNNQQHPRNLDSDRNERERNLQQHERYQRNKSSNDAATSSQRERDRKIEQLRNKTFRTSNTERTIDNSQATRKPARSTTVSTKKTPEFSRVNTAPSRQSQREQVRNRKESPSASPTLPAQIRERVTSQQQRNDNPRGVQNDQRVGDRTIGRTKTPAAVKHQQAARAASREQTRRSPDVEEQKAQARKTMNEDQPRSQRWRNGHSH